METDLKHQMNEYICILYYYVLLLDSFHTELYNIFP